MLSKMSSLCESLREQAKEMQEECLNPQAKRMKVEEDDGMASGPVNALMQDDADTTNSRGSYEPPASLKQFLLGKVEQSIKEYFEEHQDEANQLTLVPSETNHDSTTPSIPSKLAAVYFDNLVASNPHWTNKHFSIAGNDLFKAIAKFGLLPGESASSAETDVIEFNRISLSLPQQLITRYHEFIDKNKAIFEDITTHHTDIQHKDWSSVTQDNNALEKYCTAASAMGEKIWVAEANRFMAEYVAKFFVQGGAVRHHQKVDPEYRSKEKSDLLLRDLMLNSELNRKEKIKLLDVGSCYNPIAKMEGLHEHFEVTAMDLCPADPTVYKGDFLTLEVLKKGEDVFRGEGKKVSESSPNEQYAELLGLVEGQYDAVTMSLVLSYLPTPETREVMIDKARALLVTPSVTQKIHHKGLLVIAEKTSILATPSQKQVQAKKSNKANGATGNQPPTISVDDWKAAICARGFETVTYQYLPTSDGRKSHLFVFAAVDFPPDYDPASPKPRMYIKQDFNPKQSIGSYESEL